MRQATKDTLSAFVEQAALLAATPFLAAVRTGTAPGSTGPSESEFDEFISKLRRFTVDSEPFSMKKVSDLLRGDSAVAPDTAREFENVRASLELAFRTLPPLVAKTAGDPPPPSWDLIGKATLYGIAALTDASDRERFERWRAHAPSVALAAPSLNFILAVTAGGIIYISSRFEKEIRAAGSSSAGGTGG